MKWVLIWLAIAPNGTITSGSAEFTTQAGCIVAQGGVRKAALELTESGRGLVRVQAACLNSDSGLPQ